MHVIREPRVMTAASIHAEPLPAARLSDGEMVSSGNPYVDKLRDFMARDEPAYPAGFPEIRATSCVKPELGPEHLVHGMELPWHAQSPPDYPEGIEFSFPSLLDCTAFWMQAQEGHFNRAPRCFQLVASRDGTTWEPILTVPDTAWADPTGWQCWKIERTGPWRAFRLAILSNAGDPQFLTVRRVWFEPRFGNRGGLRPQDGRDRITTGRSCAASGAGLEIDKCEILILQMGKVASNTIRKTIDHHVGRPISRHLHHLSPGRLESQVQNMDSSVPAAWRESMLNQLVEGVRTLEYIRNDSSRRWKIVTLCRDPMSQIVSSFFQQMPYLYPSVSDRYRDGSETINAAVDFFARHVDRLVSNKPAEDAFVSRVLRHVVELPLVWFQEEIAGALRYPIFRQVFDRAGGYSIYSQGHVDFLVIRYEQLADVLRKSLADFLGLRIDKVISENVTGDKPVHAMYREFVNTAKFDDAILEHYYESAYARFFYTDEEIKQARLRWTR